MTDLCLEHDGYFKKIFSRTDIAARHLARTLPPELSNLIDFSTLEVEESGFIDPQLRTYFSDLLFRVR